MSDHTKALADALERALSIIGPDWYDGQGRPLAAWHKKASKHLAAYRATQQTKASDVADAAQVIAWARSNPRPPANSAFTAGPERQAAYWIEWAQASEPAHAAPIGLMEAVDYTLSQAPCDCPQAMRFERGEHMSGCYLFDLNEEYAKTSVCQASEQGQEPLEIMAKAIYRQFFGAEKYPWKDGGNSLKQDEARQYARAALAAQQGGKP